MIAAADYGSIGTAIALVFIGFMSIWNKRDISKVHTLVNSSYGENLRIGLVSAKALAISSPSPENDRLAREAEIKYQDHVAKQAAADK